MAKRFFPSFESEANDFAATKLRLGEYGVIRVNGVRYNVVPMKDKTTLSIGDNVFTRAGGNYGIYSIIAIEDRWFYLGKKEKKKGRVVRADIFGKVI